MLSSAGRVGPRIVEAEGLSNRTAAGKTRLPLGLKGQFRLGIRDAGTNGCGRQRDQAVVIAHHQVAR